MRSEPPVINDRLGTLLAATVRLMRGAVAAAVVSASGNEAPAGWATTEVAGLAEELRAVVSKRLDTVGPWGALLLAGLPERTVWIEPIAGHGPSDAEGHALQYLEGPSGTDRVIGALAVAFEGSFPALTGEEGKTVRLLARLCGGASFGVQHVEDVADQRQLDDLVSRISERLMSTTSSSLRENLDWTVETLSRYLGASAGFLRRNDHAADTSILVAEYPRRGLDADSDPLAVVPFDADSIFAATRDFKAPLVIHDPSAVSVDYAERVASATGLRVFTAAGVPLVHADVTEGCLGFVFGSQFDWSEPELNAVRAVGSLLVQLLHRIDAEERLRHSAMTDELTGLANRRALLDEVSRCPMSPRHPLAMLFLDLDRFKVMNDFLGHRAGYKLLCVIADRIRTSLRPTDFAARLGGDEFVVLLEDGGDILGAVAAAERLLELIALPIDIGGRSVTHTGSIGVAVGDHPTMSGEKLLGHADIAMYAAKSQGRNQIVVFDAGLEARVANRSNTELLLRKAMANEEFEVYYQPEFDLLTGRLLAVEALLRWHREGHGVVGAGEFIPVAEETHLITEIDRWVLEQACSQLARWRREYPAVQLDVRVNMSPAQLVMPGVVQTVQRSLRRSGLPAELLCLEITEQAMISDIDQAVHILRDVRRLGVQLAIDDFGTGYSSMVQLKNLPVNALKIDREFVDGIADDLTDQAIVDSVVRLARAFRLEVVAEGVETVPDLQTLVRLGCRRAQGFLLAQPMPASEVAPLLARRGIDLVALTAPAGARH